MGGILTEFYFCDEAHKWASQQGGRCAKKKKFSDPRM